MNTELYDEHEDQSPQTSEVPLVAEALPGLIYRRPLGKNSSFNSKIKVQTLLMSSCFENALILKITFRNIILSYQNDNLSLTFLLLKVDMKWKFLFSDMIVQAKLERRLLTVSWYLFWFQRYRHSKKFKIAPKVVHLS